MVLKIIKSKKAMFFTILTISILSLFLVSYTFYSIFKNRESLNKRIETMNNFVFSFEQDMPRQLYASGFRIIFLFEKRITETGTYISDFDSTFEELFFNGTLYGDSNPEIDSLMSGAKFSDIENSFSEKAEKINMNISFSSPSISVTQEDPWQIKITLTTDLLIQDKANVALWDKIFSIDSYIPVESFDDPIYTLNTNGLVINKIIKTPYDDFVTENDVSNLISHLQNSYYINSTSAPSFLDRLQGINSPSSYGIESLVYLPELSQQGLSIKEKSCVDYIYFSDSDPTSHHIQGMPSWFKLDDGHLSIYEVSELTID